MESVKLKIEKVLLSKKHRSVHVEVSYNPRTCTYAIRSLYVFCTCNGTCFSIAMTTLGLAPILVELSVSEYNDACIYC